MSYHEREPGNIREISSPFYGHSVYSGRPTSNIYLPGRENAAVIGVDGRPVKVKVHFLIKLTLSFFHALYPFIEQTGRLIWLPYATLINTNDTRV